MASIAGHPNATDVVADGGDGADDTCVSGTGADTAALPPSDTSSPVPSDHASGGSADVAAGGSDDGDEGGAESTGDAAPHQPPTATPSGDGSQGGGGSAGAAYGSGEVDDEIDEAEVEELLANLDPRDRKILALMAELDEERQRRRAVNMDIFRVKERVAEEVARLEATIQEQDEQNEKLVEAAKLKSEEMELMSELLTVRDKEVAELKRAASQAAFQLDCRRGDVLELSDQLRRKNATLRALESKLQSLVQAAGDRSGGGVVGGDMSVSDHSSGAGTENPEGREPTATTDWLHAAAAGDDDQAGLAEVELHTAGFSDDDDEDHTPHTSKQAVWGLVTALENQVAALQQQVAETTAAAAAVQAPAPSGTPPRRPDSGALLTELQAWRGPVAEPTHRSRSTSSEFAIPASDSLSHLEEARVMVQNLHAELLRLHDDCEANDAEDEGHHPHRRHAVAAVDFSQPVVVVLRHLVDQTVAVVDSQLQHVSALRDDLNTALDERDEHQDSLTQAGEFGQFLLQENEELKAKLAAATNSSTSSTGMAAGTGVKSGPLQLPPAVQRSPSNSLAPPMSPPEDAVKGSAGGTGSGSGTVAVAMGSPVFSTDKDWSVIGGVGAGGTDDPSAKAVTLKRSMEQLQRHNRALEREHQRAMDTLRATDEELEATRAQLSDARQRVDALQRQLADTATDLTDARVAAVEARGEAATARQEADDAQRQVARLHNALRQEQTLSSPPRAPRTEMSSPERARLQDELSRATGEATELRARLHSTEEALRCRRSEVEGRAAGVRSQHKEQEEAWARERSELLAANSRLHEERMELRSLLDAERAKASGPPMFTGQSEDVGRLRAELRDAEDELDALKTQLAQTQANNSRFATAAKDAEAEAASKVRSAQSEAAALTTRLRLAEEEVQSLKAHHKEREAALQTAAQAARGSLRDMEQQLRAAGAEKEELAAVAAAAKQHAQVVETKATEMSERFGQEMGTLDATITELKAKLGKDDGHVRELQSKLEGKEEEVSQLGSKVVELTSELEQLVAQTSLVNRIDDTRQQAMERGLKESQEALNQYRGLLKQKTARVKSLEQERSKAREVRLELERTLHQLQAKVDKMHKALVAAQKDRVQLQRELAGWQQESKGWEDIARGYLAAAGDPLGRRRASAASTSSAGPEVPPHPINNPYARIVAQSSARNDPSAWRHNLAAAQPHRAARLTPTLEPYNPQVAAVTHRPVARTPPSASPASRRQAGLSPGSASTASASGVIVSPEASGLSPSGRPPRPHTTAAAASAGATATAAPSATSSGGGAMSSLPSSASSLASSSSSIASLVAADGGAATEPFGGITVAVSTRPSGPPIRVDTLQLSGPTPSPALPILLPAAQSPPRMHAPDAGSDTDSPAGGASAGASQSPPTPMWTAPETAAAPAAPDAPDAAMPPSPPEQQQQQPHAYHTITPRAVAELSAGAASALAAAGALSATNTSVLSAATSASAHSVSPSRRASARDRVRARAAAAEAKAIERRALAQRRKANRMDR